MKSLFSVPPLRWFLLLWVSLMYIWGVTFLWNWSQQLHRAALLLTIFSILMLLHSGLYWRSSVFQQKYWQWLYLCTQGLLILLMSLISLDWNMAIGLSLALTGEIVTVLHRLRLALLVTLGYLVLLALSFTLKGSWLRLVIMLGILPQGPANQLPLPFFFGWERLLNILEVAPVLLFVVGYLLLFRQQIQSREHAQQLLDELADAHGELEVAYVRIAAYAQHTENLTRVTERQRMARELHDTLAQGLTGLIMQLEVVDALLTERSADRAQEIVWTAMTNARETLTEARQAIADLRSETENAYNFSRAIYKEVSRFTSATGLPCIIHLGSLIDVPGVLCEHALRSLSEGLTNVARHAHAQHVWLHIHVCDGVLDITIRDDGVGFHPEEVREGAGHYGLLGLQERARLTAGMLEISSCPGTGTTIHLRLGVNSEGRSDE